MGDEKKKYEELIRASKLFQLDKETEHTAYERESKRLVEYLYCYLMAVNRQKYEDYACEIVETAAYCIKNYDPVMGEFFNYFLSSWKQNYRHTCGNEVLEKKLQGVRVTEENRRNVRKWLQYAQQNQSKMGPEEMYQFISEQMDIPLHEVRELAGLAEFNVVSDNYINADGETQSLYDQKAATGPSPEQALNSRENMGELLQSIEESYQKLQERQKPIISDLMTSAICSELHNSAAPSLLSARYTFLSRKIIVDWYQTGQVPMQKAIGEKYGRSEASISRTLKNFISKLRKDNENGIE